MPREPVVMELTPPPDPWEVAQRFARFKPVLFLDSAGGPPDLGRYSYVAAADPQDVLASGYPTRIADDPFARVRRVLERSPAAAVEGLPPFQGGIAGLFAYDLCHHLERLPRPRLTHQDFLRTPNLLVGRFNWVVAWDHKVGQAWIIAHGWETPWATDPAGEHRKSAWQQATSVKHALESPPEGPDRARVDVLKSEPPGQFPLPGHANVWSNFDRRGFEDAVRQAVAYTHAGDCFQVNIAQRLVTPLRERPLELYGRLRRVNPAPFAAYFDVGDVQILSASPERFIKMSHDGQIETRPIKGTRSRGYTPEHDAALHGDLLESEKDRAENVMIVDLLRNDLGRVCEYGSVQVSELCRLESYSTVHHLVSEVRGQLRQGLSAIDVLKAAFPGGSVTGAPKVRAMEIIAELEPHARGPYCGCLGWIGFDGAMDTNILIRTFTAAGGWLQFPVGGGIVADSDPEREYEETLHKAAGLLRALEEP